MLSAESEGWTHFFSYSCCMLVKFMRKPSKNIVQWYFSCLQSKMNKNQPLNWLRDVCFMAGLRNWLAQKQKNQRIAAMEWTWQHNEQKRRQPNGRFKLFLHKEINTLHEYSCTPNSVFVHVTCSVLTVHAICEGVGLLRRTAFSHSRRTIWFFWKILEHIASCK